jgi:hypothetical protein
VKNAIGVTDDSVEGIDIKTSQLSFSVTHYLPVALMTRSYVGALFDLTGKVNGADWWFFKAGEILLEGVSGSKRGADDWELSFKFNASENQTDIDLGNEIIVGEKEGHEYLWIMYRDSNDAAAKRRTKVPFAAYTAQVYRYGDFSKLGLETSLFALFPGQ